MKHFLTVFILLAGAFAFPTQAQTPPETPPPAFSYQALVRDNAGQPVRNAQVGVRIRLHQDSANAAIAFAETFAPTTNAHGGLNLSIGRGDAVTGTFEALDWSRPMYIETGVDVNGGTAYVDLGTTQLLSVPYAMYAGRSGSTTSDADADPTNEIQVLSVNGDSLFLSRDGGRIQLPTPRIRQIEDSNGDTRITTEGSPDDNIIRFILSGAEKLRLRGNALEFPSPGRSVHIGDDAGAALSTATLVHNVFVGFQAGMANTNGFQNSFLGGLAGTKNTTGSRNTFTGYSAGWNTTTAIGNTFTGAVSGYDNTTGSYNTFSGTESGDQNTSGSYNTFLGAHAGENNITGSKNTYVGARSGAAFAVSGSDSLNVLIGYNVSVIGSHKLAIDNSSTSAPLIAGDFLENEITINGDLLYTGSLTGPSDRRLKENIETLPDALSKLDRLNGVYYRWKPDTNPENIRGRGRQIGVIAQDVEEVYPELVTTSADGYKAVDYAKLTAVLIEAVKELRAENAKLKADHAARLERIESALRLSQNGKPESGRQKLARAPVIPKSSSSIRVPSDSEKTSPFKGTEEW